MPGHSRRRVAGRLCGVKALLASALAAGTYPNTAVAAATLADALGCDSEVDLHFRTDYDRIIVNYDWTF